MQLLEAPWPDLYGKPLDARRLARELARYGVKPVTFDTSGNKTKGYVTFETTGKQAQVGLDDAWSRYLPTPVHNSGNDGNSPPTSVMDTSPVTNSPGTTDRSVTP